MKRTFDFTFAVVSLILAVLLADLAWTFTNPDPIIRLIFAFGAISNALQALVYLRSALRSHYDRIGD
jgi:hypothetical protein